LRIIGIFYISLCLNSDLASLAKAAVSGDEAALDMLSWKKGKVKMSLGPQESLSFFVGGIKGEYENDLWWSRVCFVTKGNVFY